MTDEILLAKLAEAKKVHEEKMQKLEELRGAAHKSLQEINKKVHAECVEWHAVNKFWHDFFHPTTEHSLENRRKKEKYNIRRFICDRLQEWQNAKYYDCKNADVKFEDTEEGIVYTVKIKKL